MLKGSIRAAPATQKRLKGIRACRARCANPASIMSSISTLPQKRTNDQSFVIRNSME